MRAHKPTYCPLYKHSPPDQINWTCHVLVLKQETENNKKEKKKHHTFFGKKVQIYIKKIKFFSFFLPFLDSGGFQKNKDHECHLCSL